MATEADNTAGVQWLEHLVSTITKYEVDTECNTSCNSLSPNKGDPSYTENDYFSNGSTKLMPKVDGSELTLDHSNASCGITTIWGLNNQPKYIVHRVMEYRTHRDYKYIREAFVIFSDTNSRRKNLTIGGFALAKYIQDHKLGDIWESPVRTNPNTGNEIVVWVWMPPHKSFSVFAKQLPVVSKEESEKIFAEQRRSDNRG